MSTASAANVQLQLPDGTLAEHPAHATAMDVALGISEGLARSVIAAEVSGVVVDANRPLGELAAGGPAVVAEIADPPRRPKRWASFATPRRT